MFKIGDDAYLIDGRKVYIIDKTNSGYYVSEYFFDGENYGDVEFVGNEILRVQEHNLYKSAPKPVYASDIKKNEDKLKELRKEVLELEHQVFHLKMEKASIQELVDSCLPLKKELQTIIDLYSGEITWVITKEYDTYKLFSWRDYCEDKQDWVKLLSIACNSTTNKRPEFFWEFKEDESPRVKLYLFKTYEEANKKFNQLITDLFAKIIKEDKYLTDSTLTYYASKGFQIPDILITRMLSHEKTRYLNENAWKERYATEAKEAYKKLLDKYNKKDEDF